MGILALQFRASVAGSIGKRRQVSIVVVIDTANDDRDDEGGGDQQVDDEVPRAAVGEVALRPEGAEQGGPGGHGHGADKAVAGKAGAGERYDFSFPRCLQFKEMLIEFVQKKLVHNNCYKFVRLVS